MPVSDTTCISLDEAARELSISVRSLRRRIAERKIPAVRIGRRVVLARATIAAFIARAEARDAA